MNVIHEGIKKVINIGEHVLSDAKVLNIAYGVDRKFLFGAAVSMQSVTIYNPSEKIAFHIFTDYVDDDYINRVSLFVSDNENVTVSIYIVSEKYVEIFPSLKQWSYATFFRFIAFQILSEKVETVLYLDADVVCKGSLSELLDISFDEDIYAAVVRDVAFMQDKPAKRLNIAGLPGNYFNAGVIYLSLQAWAKNDFMNKAIKMLTSDPDHQKYKCLDQDILNILFYGHCKYISGDYDCFYGVDYELKNNSDSDYMKTITENTKLIHYVGVTKPWHNWVNYPCEIYFKDAYSQSHWRDIPLLAACGEKEFKVKYQHSLKAKRYVDAITCYIRYRFLKLRNKHYR